MRRALPKYSFTLVAVMVLALLHCLLSSAGKHAASRGTLASVSDSSLAHNDGGRHRSDGSARGVGRAGRGNHAHRGSYLLAPVPRYGLALHQAPKPIQRSCCLMSVPADRVLQCSLCSQPTRALQLNLGVMRQQTSL